MLEQISTAKIFSERLEKLGAKYRNLVVLDTNLRQNIAANNFAKSFPDRYFSFPLQDNIVTSAASGFAIRGKIPFCLGPAASLISGNLASLRQQIVPNNLNLKLIGFNAGLSESENGLLDQSTEDLAQTLSLPNLKILVPTDQNELKVHLETLCSDFGPTYLRLSKDLLVNPLHNSSDDLPILKNGEELAIICLGGLLPEVYQASSELEKRGISLKLISIPCLQPLPKSLFSQIEKVKLLVTIEDHYHFGGLGSLIEQLLLEQQVIIPLLKIGTRQICEAGKPQELLKKHNLDSKSLYETIRNRWLEI